VNIVVFLSNSKVGRKRQENAVFRSVLNSFFLPFIDTAFYVSAIAGLRKITRHAMEEREAHGAESRDFILLDAIIGHHDDEDKRFADTITYFVGGFHTTGNRKEHFTKHTFTVIMRHLQVQIPNADQSDNYNFPSI
jgi:hypothetical protein